MKRIIQKNQFGIRSSQVTCRHLSWAVNGWKVEPTCQRQRLSGDPNLAMKRGYSHDWVAGDPEISWPGQISEARWQAGHRSLSGLSLFHGPRYSIRLGSGRSGLSSTAFAGHAMGLLHRGLYSEKTRVPLPLFCALRVTQLNDSIWGRKKTQSSKATWIAYFNPFHK